MKSAAKSREVKKQLRALVPQASMSDFLEMEKIASAGHLRHLPPSIAAWQSVTTIARHLHTDYDQLLEEGYDAESARHFVLDDINETLEKWGCTRKLSADETG